jgi:predicted SAM-dependent methyltransferase
MVERMTKRVAARRLKDRWDSRLLLRFIPLHVAQIARYELQMAVARLLAGAARRRYRGSQALLVNLGCGAKGLEGWINVDSVRLPGVSCVWDSRRGLPFPDGSVRAIFCEHFLEHIDYDDEAPRLLSDCVRVLEPGGVLRLVVPDAERYVRAYVAEDWSEMRKLRSCDRFRTKMEVMNQVFRQGIQHKFAYDYETLAALCRRAGFAKVERMAFGHSTISELAIDQPRRAAESLYVEATK